MAQGHVDNATCEFGDIRLEDGGVSPQLGRVEVCLNGVWGLVCSQGWDVVDATVACRQLGYDEGTARNRHRAFLFMRLSQ